MKTRYQILKQENNIKCQHLSGEYQKLAIKIVKQARKIGVKNEDTEVIIKNIIDQLFDYENRLVIYQTVIINEENFIKDNLQNISKKVPKKFLPKEIIASIIFCLAIISFFVIAGWLKEKNFFASPTNVIAIKENETTLKITWDEMYYTDNGFTIYIVGQTDQVKSYEQVVKTNECFFTISVKQTYDIYVKVNSTDLIDESSYTKITYVFE